MGILIQLKVLLFNLEQNIFKKVNEIARPCPSNAMGPTYKSTNCIWPNSYVIWHRISHIYVPRVGMWMVISSQDCIILNIWLFYFWFMSQVLIKYGQLCLKGEFLRHFKVNKCLKVQGYREIWPSLTFQWFTI